jgi:ABC-type transport system involved in Fe-S cluster assembly fused permease/ATPase subunit
MAMMFSILRRYAQQHAVLLISHNLRRLMSANEINLLENGVVTNRGKPESLLQSSRRLQALWQCQQQLPVIHLHEPAYVL